MNENTPVRPVTNKGKTKRAAVETVVVNSPVTDNVTPISPVPKRTGRPKKDPNAPKTKNPNMNNNPKGGDLFKGEVNANAGDNAKILALNMRLFQMPDIKITDPPSVKSRLAEFFQLYAEYDMKPTVAGMAMALGIDRRRLWEIKVGQYRGELPPEVGDSVKRAYRVLENMWETYMNSGKINPVSGIFLGKNNYGYQDRSEYIVTPNAQSESQFSAEDIARRYALESGSAREIVIEADGTE